MTTIQHAGGVPEWTLQDRIRKAREYAGLDQSELGEAIGLSRTSIGNYERGITTPRRPVMLAWAMATGVDLGWLEGVYAIRDSNPEPAGLWHRPRLVVVS